MFSHFLRKFVGGPSAVEVHECEHAGILWRMSQLGVTQLGNAGLDISNMPKVVIKENLQRTISRVSLPGGDVFIKLCRVNTPRTWFRELLRPAKAQLEFENAVHLQRLGIRSISALAWGQPLGWMPRESYLITAASLAKFTLAEFLESLTASTSERIRFARIFAEFLAQLHDAGVTHPDPHPGNFLVETDTDAQPKLVLMDLHALHFGEPLSQQQTVENLTLVNRWFQVRAQRTDRWRFWKHYFKSRTKWTGTIAPSTSIAREIEEATSKSNLRFWTARMDRYVAKNRDSHPIKHAHLRGFTTSDLPRELLASLQANPDLPFESSEKLIKDSRTSSVAIVEHQGHRYIWKRFNVKSWLLPIKNRFRPSPALRSWLNGNSVRDRGLPTARPLLLLEQYRLGFPTTGYVLFEWIDDSEELPSALTHLTGHPMKERFLAEWIFKLARLLRRLHDREVSHRDLKGSNILVKGSDPWNAEPVLIDLVGVELNRPVSDHTRQRDLARLAASFLQHALIRRSTKLRFLQHYLGLFPAKNADWKQWWQSIVQLVEQKIVRNQQSGRVLN